MQEKVPKVTPLLVKKEYPPNFQLIKEALPTVPGILYCYGDALYNPDDITIGPDVEYHEYLHSQRQSDNPEVWWNQYLLDKEFRLAEELHAYRGQYQFARKAGVVGKMGDWLLDNLAEALTSPAYKLGLTFGQARCLIKK